MKRLHWLMIALLSMILAATLFYYNHLYIPAFEATVKAAAFDEIEKQEAVGFAAVITHRDGIAKNTIITEAILNESVAVVKIPSAYVQDKGISDPYALIGQMTLEDLRFGEQIHQESLGSSLSQYGDMERLREYKVKNTVGNLLTDGQEIDILVSYPKGGYDVVTAKKMLRKVIIEGDVQRLDEFGGYLPERNLPEATVIIAVNEEEYACLEAAKAVGLLEVRIYLDKNQPASKVTFFSADIGTGAGSRQETAHNAPEGGPS